MFERVRPPSVSSAGATQEQRRPEAIASERILQLQRTLGNRAMSRLLATAGRGVPIVQRAVVIAQDGVGHEEDPAGIVSGNDGRLHDAAGHPVTLGEDGVYYEDGARSLVPATDGMSAAAPGATTSPPAPAASSPSLATAAGGGTIAVAGMVGGGLGGSPQLRPPAFPVEEIPPEVWRMPPIGGSAARTAAHATTDVVVGQAERAVVTRATEQVLVRTGEKLVSEEALAAVGAAALADEWNPVGWILDGVFVVLLVADVGYALYQLHTDVEAVPAQAPGATPAGARVVDPTPVNPMIGPPLAPPGPVSAPGQDGAPVSAPGQNSSTEPLTAANPTFSPPTNRKPFDTQSEAYGAAVALLPTSGRRILERTEPIRRTPGESGTVEYWRYSGPPAPIGVHDDVVRDGDLIAIVWHDQDPTQYRHYHVVLPPAASGAPAIEHGGLYSEPFRGTENQHLSVEPRGTGGTPQP